MTRREKGNVQMEEDGKGRISHEKEIISGKRERRKNKDILIIT